MERCKEIPLSQTAAEREKMLAKTKFHVFFDSLKSPTLNEMSAKKKTTGRNSANFVLKSFSQYCGYACKYPKLSLL